MPATAERPPVAEAPPAITFPLFIGNPCLWYPNGTKDDGRPCIMLRRENQFMVSLLEFHHGTNERHNYVRHIDDPFFQQKPHARNATKRGQNDDGGCWDYQQGHVYDFPRPGQEIVQRAPKNAFAPELLAKVMELHSQGKTPAEIAAFLATPGLKGDVVAKIIAGQYPPQIN